MVQEFHVHQHCVRAPKWDPSRNWANAVKQLQKSTKRWGPDRRRSGPHPERNFFLYIDALRLISSGVPFGADSQTGVKIAKRAARI
jgi:hypothetical protein